MGIVDDIENTTKDYLDGDYEIIPFEGVPTIDNISFGKRAVKTKLVTFSVDLRKSSQLLFEHQNQTTGKIHKAFLTAIVKTIRNFGGEVRDFQGDSILAFWDGRSKPDLNNAVKAALGVRWLLSTKLANYFNKYTELDYGIGIDWGEVYVIRAGIKRNPNNNDLVYIGKSVNFAVAIANQASLPNALEISSVIFDNLSDDIKIDDEGKNMWKDGIVEWNNQKFDSKRSSYYRTFS